MIMPRISFHCTALGQRRKQGGLPKHLHATSSLALNVPNRRFLLTYYRDGWEIRQLHFVVVYCSDVHVLLFLNYHMRIAGCYQSATEEKAKEKFSVVHSNVG